MNSMIFIRFFSILQRNWTYEVEYHLEIIRMITINIVFLLTPVVLSRILDVSNIIRILVFFPPIVFWWYYLRYSIGRFIQIKSNKKYAILIKYEIINDILKAYPNKYLYCKINKKYKKIKTIDDLSTDDIILLVTIGKTPVYELKKLKRLI